ncbi:MAG: hypothetical protein JWM40_1134 [Frankiales bacterium]|nr:hypothetical protein [Frankiales bacterium]
MCGRGAYPRLVRGLTRATAAAGLLGVALITVGIGIATRPVGDQATRQRLTGRADGTVTQFEALDDVDTRLTIRWNDDGGNGHEFSYVTDTYPWDVGDDVDVDYDPKNLKRALPEEDITGDGDRRSAAITEGVALAVAGCLPGLIITFWPRRAKVFGCDPLRTWPRNTPGTPAPADVQLSWRSYGRSAQLSLLGGLVLVLAGAGLAAVVQHHDAQLLRSGLHTSGTIGGDHVGSRYSQSSVEVTYEDRQGEEHRGTLHGPDNDDLRLGSHIDVIYDRQVPSRFRTTDYSNHGNITDAALLGLPGFGAFFGVTGCLMLWRWQRGLRLLGSSTLIDYRIIGVRRFSRRRSLLLSVQDNAGDGCIVLRFTGTELSLQDLELLEERERVSLLASPFHIDALVSAEGLDRAYVASLPRTQRQRGRWLARIGQAAPQRIAP